MKSDTPGVTSNAVDGQNPWLGLVSFTEETKRFFHGREEEGAELARRVQRKLLTVLFGQSGLGKTSILQAGLVPRLRPEGFCPVYVRLDYHPSSPSPADQIKRAVFEATLAAGTWTQTGSAVTGESLWEFLHHRDDFLKDASGRTLTPILIFDQFEEIFTLAQTDDVGRQRARDFLGDLANLVENRPPAELEARLDRDEADAEKFDFGRADYRILISLREDYLANLEALKSEMPSITQNRMRLARMTGSQAIAAVRGPALALVSEPVAEAIVRFVAGGAELANAEVEPSLLSLICRELNEARRTRGQAEISADLLAGSRDTILSEFYERSLADQPAGVRIFIEDEMLTDSGYRESIAEERVRKAFVAAGARPAALAQLVDRRLLRIEDRLDLRRVEITHDVLCRVIGASRAIRREREALEASRRELAAQQEREQATRRALVRARTIATVCAVLMLAALGSAIFGWFSLRRAREADAQAQASRRLAEQARGESEKLIAFLLDDFYQELMPTGRGEIVGQLADRAVAYYDALPAELLSDQTQLFRGMALVRKATALNDAGKSAEAREVSERAQKLFKEIRAKGGRDEEADTGLALALFSKITVVALRNDREDLLAASKLLRPLVQAGRASHSTKLVFADMLQFVAHSETRAEDAIPLCEESRALLTEMGALKYTDLTAASIYGDVTDTESRMYQRLGQLDEAARLAAIVGETSAKVLEQRPGDMRAMRNRSLAANMVGIVAQGRHELDKAEAAFAAENEANRYYCRFNPSDSTAWVSLANSLTGMARLHVEQGRIAEAVATYHEVTAIERDPHNGSGMPAPVAYAWGEIARLESLRGNLDAAKVAQGEAKRAMALTVRDRDIDEELAAVAAIGMDALELDQLAARGDYATLHDRAAQFATRLAAIKKEAPSNAVFRSNTARGLQIWQSESAMRLGLFEEATAATQEFLANPRAGRWTSRQQIEENTNRAKVRFGQSLLGAGRRDEAMVPLNEAVTYYREQAKQGASGTAFRLDFSRALYQLAQAQPGDVASAARRQTLLAEAEGVLTGMTFEAQQLWLGKELMQSVRQARAAVGQ